ncbi:hypothetical protein OROHE_007624 [Orobanche hederae]
MAQRRRSLWTNRLENLETCCKEGKGRRIQQNRYYVEEGSSLCRWFTAPTTVTTLAHDSIPLFIDRIVHRKLHDPPFPQRPLSRSLQDDPSARKISPPSPYTVVNGALDSGGPVLRRTFQDEEVNVSVMRMVDIVPGGSGEDYSEDNINQLFLYVDISKPQLQESLHFLCGLYPDALGIHSVSLRPKADSSGFLLVPSKYNGPVFDE